MHPSMFAVITGATGETRLSPFDHLAPILQLFYDTVLLGTKLIPLALTLGDTVEWGKEVGFLFGPTRSQSEDSFIAQAMHLAMMYGQHSILTHKGFHIVDTGEITPIRNLNIKPVAEPNLLTFKDPLFSYQSAFNGSATGVTLVCPLDPTFRPYFLEAIP